MSIATAQLRQLTAEMATLFANAGLSDFDVSLDTSGGRYGETDVSLKLTAKLKGVKSTSDAAFERKVAEHGLRLIGAKGETLTGYNSNRPKYPYSYVTVRGARYKQSIDSAKAMFG